MVGSPTVKMILSSTKIKARLIEIPKIKKKGSEELIEYGTFTVNKRYRVYSIYSEQKFTSFLVADDNNIFTWINSGSFRK